MFLFHSCQKILHKFSQLCENGVDFTDNPLHLQMLTEYMKNIKTDEDIEKIGKVDLVNIYEYFICTKIESGLNCKGIFKLFIGFNDKVNDIYNILTEKSIALVKQVKEESYLNNEDELEDDSVDKDHKNNFFEFITGLFFAKTFKLLQTMRQSYSALRKKIAAEELHVIEVSLDVKDQENINMSGVAIILDNKMIFVHLTFAEFLTARHFVKMCYASTLKFKVMDLGVHDLLKNDVTKQTLNFIENILDNDEVKTINFEFTGRIKVIKEVFERVCKSGMSKLFSLLWTTDSDGELVKQWIEESHDDEKIGLFFHACCSSLELADKLSKWCPMLEITNVDKLVNCLATLTNSRLVLEKALSQVPNWKNNWPKQNFFTTFYTDISTEFYEFAYENRANLDPKSLLKLIYARKNCSPGLIPVLLKLGLNLMHKVDISYKRRVRLVHLFPFSSVIGPIIKMARHFANNNDMDSEENLLFIKNLGARRPLEEEDRSTYLDYIVKRLCLCFDSCICDGITNLPIMEMENDSAIETLAQEFAQLRPLATQYKLYLIRSNFDDSYTLSLFHEVEQYIQRNLKFKCGCNLLHYACRNKNLPLLEALKEKGFFMLSDKEDYIGPPPMVTPNSSNETPLHKATASNNINSVGLYNKNFKGLLNAV